MEKTNRKQYLKEYARKWRGANQLKFIETQLRYWEKKKEEFFLK